MYQSITDILDEIALEAFEAHGDREPLDLWLKEDQDRRAYRSDPDAWLAAYEVSPSDPQAKKNSQGSGPAEPTPSARPTLAPADQPCPNCRSPLGPAESKFCGKCGFALPQPATPAHVVGGIVPKTPAPANNNPPAPQPAAAQPTNAAKPPMAEQDYKKRVDAAFTSLEKAREMVRRGTIGPMHPLPDEGIRPIPIAPSKKAAMDPGISPTELYQKKVDEAFKQLQEAKRHAEAGTYCRPYLPESAQQKAAQGKKEKKPSKIARLRGLTLQRKSSKPEVVQSNTTQPRSSENQNQSAGYEIRSFPTTKRPFAFI
jgi:hypothetical protein